MAYEQKFTSHTSGGQKNPVKSTCRLYSQSSFPRWAFLPVTSHIRRGKLALQGSSGDDQFGKGQQHLPFLVSQSLSRMQDIGSFWGNLELGKYVWNTSWTSGRLGTRGGFSGTRGLTDLRQCITMLMSICIGETVPIAGHQLHPLQMMSVRWTLVLCFMSIDDADVYYTFLE